MTKRDPHPAHESAARLRGALWAEDVARALVRRWPSWRPSPRALSIAYRRVAGLGAEGEERAHLARVCFDAAAQRFRELLEYLERRRLEVPTRAGDDDDDTPK